MPRAGRTCGASTESWASHSSGCTNRESACNDSSTRESTPSGYTNRESAHNGIAPSKSTRHNPTTSESTGSDSATTEEEMGQLVSLEFSARRWELLGQHSFRHSELKGNGEGWGRVHER